MDRAVALTLLTMTLVLVAASAVAWTVESPLERYETVVPAPGEAPTLYVPFDDPVLDDASTLLHAAVVESLRKAPLLVAFVVLIVGLVAWSRGKVLRPVFARVYATLAPLLAASAVGAALFTPPDVLSTLILIALQWTVYTPIALVLLAVFSRIAAQRNA